mmetsp:Transcript_13413/g.20386  ORF Transcript_13413/g.20386 Transcript_13413/m.20386 type:complete len:650 (+) Transcript_13413:65-2014(+)|eukprot:CAMPEP_0196814602 /NCGR_PEP_ID=MMETSP1362-20130617/44411_1 /TAXON_ID=163516 /ORGANISM="Leptocylindrus danicus, Strain CCMP1856" /LENGTH=649 /DNA_ID=CAMNT_0042191279 /DNA_START=21 /DNA_END=1970 /DNA_ORIENTATION=-
MIISRKALLAALALLAVGDVEGFAFSSKEASACLQLYPRLEQNAFHYTAAGTTKSHTNTGFRLAMGGDEFDIEDDMGGAAEDDPLIPKMKPTIIQPKKLVDLGGLGRYSDEERESLNAEIREEVAKTFEKQVQNVENMKTKLKEDVAKSKEASREDSERRAQEAGERFMAKTDAMIDEFLAKTQGERAATKMAAEADARMVGRGLDVGSWGVDKYGRAVLTGSETGSKGLYDTALKANVDGETTSSTGNSLADPKILIVTGDKPEAPVQELVERLTSMLADSDFPISTIPTTAKLARIGGGDASTCLILPGAADDSTSMNRLVDRIRSPTASTVDGPPSHVVYIGSLGTDRTNSFPYSMQNMLGQLDKKLEAEASLKSTVCAEPSISSEIEQEAADFSIIKIGKLLSDSKKIKADQKKAKDALDGSVSLAMAWGDSLDGDISVSDAANVIYQTVLLQPAARNATFSVSTYSSDAADANQEQWDDLFLKLVGPELRRFDIPAENDFGELSAFLEEWALVFERSPASKTGLTTPVTVSRSKTLPNAFGVEIRFKETNTGTAYSTSKEDRKAEKLRNTGYSNNGGSGAKSEIKVKNPRKEGGVEILVEQYPTYRVRARRCNMDGKTVVKEMSESSILKRLEQDLDYYLNRKK